MVQILYYFLHEVSLLKPNYPTSWPQKNNRNHHHLSVTSPCFPAREAGWIQQLLSCWDSGPGNSEPFISDVCREGGKCCRAQASVMAILAATCLTARVRPGSAQRPASVTPISRSICKLSAVGLRPSFLSFPRQNSGSHCIYYEVCSFLYFSMPPIIRQMTDLIIVFQRRTKKHYGIKVHINFKILHHFRNVEM